MDKQVEKTGLSRRDFLKTSAAAAMVVGAGPLLMSQGVHAAGADVIKVGIIGCGGRGRGAGRDCVTSEGVKIVALGDVFQDQVDECYKSYTTNDEMKSKCDLTKDRCFSGFDCYKKVIASGVDLVILASPPGFRPAHFEAAIEAGKHVFMEKPVAVDAPGVRKIIASGEAAAQKKLGVVAGTQRRHSKDFVETIKRIQDGAIGDIVGGQCYWNQGGLWNRGRDPKWTDMEWQIRNWLYFTWLSGDHICEQHVHNIDVINWAIGAHPVKCMGMGGREVRTDPAYGHIFDHFAVDFEYPNGVKVMSMCRQIDGCAGGQHERVVGTKGASNCCRWIDGAGAWKFEGDVPPAMHQEHKDLIASIRAGTPLNEAKRIAESTLSAIMGRMSAYTGQEISWDQALNSKEDLTPAKLEFGPIEVPPVAVPGRTQFV